MRLADAYNARIDEMHNAILEDGENRRTSDERKTGHWIVRETAYDDTVAKCSECGFETLVNEPGNGLHMVSELCYCPRCGARLKGSKIRVDI